MALPAKPHPQAVALTYSADSPAPVVVAKGKGHLAQAIIDKAREHGVFVHESPELVSLLMQVDLDSQIPPQLYVVVAELLAWLYRLEHGEQAPPPAPPAPGSIELEQRPRSSRT